MALVLTGRFAAVEEDSFTDKESGNKVPYMTLVVHDAADRQYRKVSVQEDDRVVVRQAVGKVLQEDKEVSLRVRVRDNGRLVFAGFVPAQG